jgi:predicted metalloprotease with PDZ domain
LAKIEAEFTLEDNRLYMNKFGAEQFPKRWAEFVQNVSAKDEKGNPVTIEELPGAEWKINAPANQKILLSYEVALKHEDSRWNGGIDGVAFARDWGVFYTGRTFLILNGKARKDIPISFQIPNGWRVTAPWNRAKKPNVFIAKDLTDLMESMFFAGTHEEFSVRRDGFELIFALGGGVSAQKEAYKNLAQGVLDYYINLMGGIPNPPPSNKFKRSVVIINAGKDLDGEVIGNHISMILDPNGDEQTHLIAKFIFAHEFFHFWNGKSINVADTTEDWFKEGITSFYPLKALHKIGAISEQEYFGTLNNLFYKRYSTDSGLENASMRDVASGASKDKHWGLIYGGGLFVGICQDVAVRRATANQKSLDNLMRDLFRTYGGSDETYTTGDIEKSLTILSGKDQAGFFTKYVFGAERVPIEKCLSDAGLDARIENGGLLISRKNSPDKLEEAILKGLLGK